MGASFLAQNVGKKSITVNLKNADGKRFMVGQHELAELAPRDIVAKGIHRVLLATGTDHLLLALVEDELGAATVPLALTTDIRPGRFDRLRLGGTPGALTLRPLAGGTARAGRAIRWRLAKARRAVGRRPTSKER